MSFRQSLGRAKSWAKRLLTCVGRSSISTSPKFFLLFEYIVFWRGFVGRNNVNAINEQIYISHLRASLIYNVYKIPRSNSLIHFNVSLILYCHQFLNCQIRNFKIICLCVFNCLYLFRLKSTPKINWFKSNTTVPTIERKNNNAHKYKLLMYQNGFTFSPVEPMLLQGHGRRGGKSGSSYICWLWDGLRESQKTDWK